MRINGKIYLEEVIPSGGRDENGASQGATLKWSEPIACHIATNQDSRLGRYEDGIFRKAEFTILIEPKDLSEEDFLERKFIRVRLKRNGASLGIYSLKEITPITIQNRIKLVVYNDE